MATHTYVTQSAVGYLNVATVTGTVDTIPPTGVIPVVVMCSLGDILAIQANGGNAGLEAFITPLMLSAAILKGLPVPAPATLTQIANGSFTVNGVTYVISSATAIGDVATIVGTVNGFATTITLSASSMSATLAVSLAALQGVIAGQMLTAAVKAGFSQSTVTQLQTGTFTF